MTTITEAATPTAATIRRRAPPRHRLGAARLVERGNPPHAGDASERRHVGLRDPPADHVRAALLLRVRRLDLGPRLLVRAVPDAGHLRPDRRVRVRRTPSIGLAEDMQKGFIDRLRSLPISQGAVLIGRTISDTLRNVVTFIVMLGVAFAIGFRFEGGAVRRAHGHAAAALLQLRVQLDPGARRALGQVGRGRQLGRLHVDVPAHVPLVGVRRHVQHAAVAADNRRRSTRSRVATNAARALYNGYDPGDAVWQALAWATGLIIVFSYLSMRRFAGTASR